MSLLNDDRVKFYGVLLLGSLLLLIPAFYNGYPLVNSDDGTYINSGFLLEVPGDRPIIYGLLLRIFSLNGLSLWLAVWVQALVVSWLVLKILLKNIEQNKYLKSILIFVALSLLTSLSWITSEIIPDVCTPMVMMSLYLLLINKETKWNTLFLYAIFFTASATHMSHFVIFMMLIVAIFLIKRLLFPQNEFRRINMVLVVLTVLSITATFINSSIYSKSKHVFLMASLSDKQILKRYLEENCPKKHYGICNYNENMETNPNWFLWNEESPLYKQGGWDSTKDEYSTIINDILTTPKYLMQFTIESLKASYQQLLDFKIGDGNFPFPAESHVYNTVAKHAPNDIDMYSKAWQHQDLIVPQLELPNKIIYATVIISFIVLLAVLIFYRKKTSKYLVFFLFVSIATILINIADCAAFAQVNGRYGCRMMWLIPFCAMLALASNKKNNATNV